MLETTAATTTASSAAQHTRLRIAIALTLSAGAWVLPALDALRDAGAGSYTAFLVVIPVLGALIATGIRPSPGVGDSEFDWILAIIFAAASLLALSLLSRRLPTMAGLWHWNHFTCLVWAMTAGMVLFSARHVLRLWRLWLFAFCVTPAVPLLLVTAHLGGTEDNAVQVAAGMGTVAVFLATSTLGAWRRFTAAAVNLAAAVLSAHLLDAGGTLLRSVVVAGVVPVLTVLTVRRAAHLRVAASVARHPARGQARFPTVGMRSYAVLGALGVALLVVAPRIPAVQPAATADSGWAERMGLTRTAEFPFITRFLGPGATLIRYTAPGGTAAVAIDVMSAPNLARLNDYADAVWYPTAAPVNFRPVRIGGPDGIDARAAQSDPDAAGAQSSQLWYALTWLWQTGSHYQRVTVVLDQDLAAADPPEPQPLTWSTALFDPMLWLTRQQPAPSGTVAKRVSPTAATVAEQVLEAGRPR